MENNVLIFNTMGKNNSGIKIENLICGNFIKYFHIFLVVINVLLACFILIINPDLKSKFGEMDDVFHFLFNLFIISMLIIESLLISIFSITTMLMFLYNLSSSKNVLVFNTILLIINIFLYEYYALCRKERIFIFISLTSFNVLIFLLLLFYFINDIKLLWCVKNKIEENMEKL